MAVEPAERGVLLSIRPRYLEAIMAETKTVELRRNRIQASHGTTVLLYSSTPVKAVIGSARIAAIDEATPERLWAKVGPSAGVTRTEFDDYFDGAKIAYGLHLEAVRRLPHPIPLKSLRSLGLEPPQSFRYLTGPQQYQLASTAAGCPASTDAASGALAGVLPRRPLQDSLLPLTRLMRPIQKLIGRLLPG